MKAKAQFEVKRISVSEKTVYVLGIEGEIDGINISYIEPHIEHLVEASNGKLYLILDLKDTLYINSKFVGYMINWFLSAKENGGKVVLSGAKEHIKDVLSVQGVFKFIPHFETTEEAKEAFK